MEADGVSVELALVEISGESCDTKVRMVCRGSSGSHDSIHSGVGAKPPIEKPDTE